MEDEEDPLRLGRAYNQSILLMLGVPYAMTGLVGFLIYRHLRRRDAMLHDAVVLSASPASPHPAGDPCPTPLSTEGSS